MEAESKSPFLEYVNKPDTKWACCISVPYGNSLWQVGYSKEQNRSYKIASERIEKELIKKERHKMKPTLDRHEIIIINNAGHNASFASVMQNKVAFSARGWNPMN